MSLVKRSEKSNGAPFKHSQSKAKDAVGGAALKRVGGAQSRYMSTYTNLGTF